MSEQILGVSARAPSNIALIKYMGKVDSFRNVPTNASLSLTLNDLCTFAQLIPQDKNFEFESIMPEGVPENLKDRAHVPDLDVKGSERILNHVTRVIEACEKLYPHYDLPYQKLEGGRLRTANTFPAQTGIASSASSFAAVTLAVAAASCTDREKFNAQYALSEFKQSLAQISRQGSGSSCRSFEGPYVMWEQEEARRVTAGMPVMTDLVCIVSRGAKKVGSSEAHTRVRTSALWKERVERVTERLGELSHALKEGLIPKVSDLVWAEAWEMHSLFHTAEPPFSYFQPRTMELLQWLDHEAKPRPIVTLDAGPNVHILVPSAEADDWEKKINARFDGIEILRDEQGVGAELLS